jgi:hypothetical protein
MFNLNRLFVRKLSVLTVIVAILAFVSAAHAITIIVDGLQEPVWTDGEGGQMPGAILDANEPGIQDSKDIEVLRYTNDGQYFYFLMETYADTDWGNFVATAFFDICLDTDNNLATGFSYDNCDGIDGVAMDGIDRLIQVRPVSFAPVVLGVTVFDENINVIYAASGAGEVVNVGAITEVRIPLDVLGLDSDATCHDNIRLGAYFDGATTEPDDNVPDSGQITISCGDPTAVSFVGLQTSSVATPWVAAVVAMALLTGALLLVARRREEVTN